MLAKNCLPLATKVDRWKLSQDLMYFDHLPPVSWCSPNKATCHHWLPRSIAGNLVKTLLALTRFLFLKGCPCLLSPVSLCWPRPLSIDSQGWASKPCQSLMCLCLRCLADMTRCFCLADVLEWEVSPVFCHLLLYWSVSSWPKLVSTGCQGWSLIPLPLPYFSVLLAS